MISCWVVIAPMTISPPSRRTPFSSGDAGEVDEMGRHGEAQLHHRNEAVAAGDDAGVGIEPAEQGDRFRETGRAMILEGSGDQDVLPSERPIGSRQDRNRARDDRVGLRAPHNQWRMNREARKGAGGGFAHEMRQHL